MKTLKTLALILMGFLALESYGQKKWTYTAWGNCNSPTSYSSLKVQGTIPYSDGHFLAFYPTLQCNWAKRNKNIEYPATYTLGVVICSEHAIAVNSERILVMELGDGSELYFAVKDPISESDNETSGSLHQATCLFDLCQTDLQKIINDGVSKIRVLDKNDVWIENTINDNSFSKSIDDLYTYTADCLSGKVIL